MDNGGTVTIFAMVVFILSVIILLIACVGATADYINNDNLELICKYAVAIVMFLIVILMTIWPWTFGFSFISTILLSFFFFCISGMLFYMVFMKQILDFFIK